MLQKLQWHFIQTPEDSMLINVSQVSLSTKVRLWHARYESVRFSNKPLLIQKALHDAGLKTATKKRQAEFWAGRCLMMLALCQNTPLRKSAFGAPEFPVGKNGALSHSHENLLFLEGPDDLLFGVDIEPPLIPASLQAVLNKVATEAERKWLNALPTQQLVYATTILFSAKETLFKLLSQEKDIFSYSSAEARAAPKSGSIVFELNQRSDCDSAVGARFLIRYDRIRENTITWGMHSPQHIFCHR